MANGIKMFIWRASKNILLTLNNLYQKKLLFQAFVLFVCNFQKPRGTFYGNVSQLGIFGAKVAGKYRSSLSSDSFLDIWLKLHSLVSKEELNEAAYTFKYI